MNETTDSNKQQRDYNEMRRKYPDLYPITAGVMLIGMGIAVGYVLFSDREGFSANLFTETISVAVTVLILNRLAEQREKKRELRHLIAQMRSKVHAEAIRAVEELNQLGWLQDGSLNEAKLWLACLKGAEMNSARLQGASLLSAHLEEAKLFSAHLEKAILADIHLNRATLVGTHLEGANLTYAYLEGADLYGAHLERVRLKATHFNEETKLPDGTYWTPETDMGRFTDSRHPSFFTPPEYEHVNIYIVGD